MFEDVLSIPSCVDRENTPLMETWNTRAKTRLKERGLTQDWLAEQFEMTPGGMQKWLAGSRQPPLEDINRIAVLLCCSPAWLTHGLDESEHLDGLAGPARESLRELIGAERAHPLPARFWAAVTAMAHSVAPPTAPMTTQEEAESPTAEAAPRNGTTADDRGRGAVVYLFPRKPHQEETP